MFSGTGRVVHSGKGTISAVGGMAAPRGGGWWGEISGVFAMVGVSGLTRCGRKLAHTERLLEDEARLCRELNAYLVLDLRPEQMPRQEFARLLCRTVATRSCFARAALLLSEPTGELSVVGSAGVDDVSVKWLNRWGGAIGAEANGGRFLLHLERRSTPGPGREGTGAMSCANMHAIPMRSANGLLGVLVVAAEARPSVRGALTPERLGRMMGPLESLCARLTLQFGRLGERAVPQPRRREHTPRSHEDRAGQRRAARRRGVERVGGPTPERVEGATVAPAAAIAAAVRSGKALLEMPSGPAPVGLPMAQSSMPCFAAPHGTTPAPGTA